MRCAPVPVALVGAGAGAVGPAVGGLRRDLQGPVEHRFGQIGLPGQQPGMAGLDLQFQAQAGICRQGRRQPGDQGLQGSGGLGIAAIGDQGDRHAMAGQCPGHGIAGRLLPVPGLFGRRGRRGFRPGEAVAIARHRRRIGRGVLRRGRTARQCSQGAGRGKDCPGQAGSPSFRRIRAIVVAQCIGCCGHGPAIARQLPS